MRHFRFLVSFIVAFLLVVGLVELARPVLIAHARSGTWSPTGSMSAARTEHTATLLKNGNVLVAGGQGTNGFPLASAELYDPSTGTWSPTGSMSNTRQLHTVTLLKDGNVLVAGGIGNGFNYLSSAELYDPSTGTWSLTGSMSTAREQSTATRLRNGNVLVAGGFDNGNVLASAELYKP